MRAPDSLELRRLALAVSVLDDVDIVPLDDGVLLTGDTPVEVSWLELRRALSGADPTDDLGRARVRAWLRGRRVAADVHPEHLREVARPVGLPDRPPAAPGPRLGAPPGARRHPRPRHRVRGSRCRPGRGRRRAPGGAGRRPGRPGAWWPVIRDYLERMGAVAAERLSDQPVLRPIGDCDVVTLLGSRKLRESLCAQDGTGLRAAAVPMRRRGWLDLSRIDPAFTAAAAAATAPEERGFSRPVLITVDEVTLAPEGGRPAEIVLRDAAVESPFLRPVLFR